MLQRERRAGQEESSRRTPAVRTKPPRASTGSAPASTARRSSSARTSRMFRGLVKYPSIPASRHRSRSPFMALAVRAMTGSRAAPVMPHAAGSRRWPPARPCGALHVHEHEVERMVREHRHRLAPVAGHEHLVPDLLDQPPHEQLVDDVVLRDKNPEPAPVLPRRVHDARAWGLFGFLAESEQDRLEQPGGRDRLDEVIGVRASSTHIKPGSAAGAGVALTATSTAPACRALMPPRLPRPGTMATFVCGWVLRNASPARRMASSGPPVPPRRMVSAPTGPAHAAPARQLRIKAIALVMEPPLRPGRM